jgi:hypothetical protein
MKHVTIKDIAKELNLAISTISRAFNDKYDIRPETKQLIWKKPGRWVIGQILLPVIYSSKSQ